MVQTVLLAWVGDNDLRAPVLNRPDRLGPIATVLSERSYDRLVLLADRDPKKTHRVGLEKLEVRVDVYENWLASRTSSPVDLRHIPLTSPTNYREIYEAARSVVDELRAEGATLTFHVSPGTPAMGAVWLLLAKTHVPATLIESSVEGGVHEVDLPFRIAAEFLPDALRQYDEQLKRASQGPTHDTAVFGNIIHRSEIMKKLLSRAGRVALRDVPVLILGESGTGKELLARAIHHASPRKEGPFVAINCGAIPANLVESELFGHVKGAFTGADRDRKGHFEQAHGGTLFLDEIGELSPAVQVSLLRVIQQGEVTRVGSSDSRKINVRIVAATHRNLLRSIEQGHFREDLFYRLAVALLQLPALRERGKDKELLLDYLLQSVNTSFGRDPGFEKKHLTAGSRAIYLNHAWPGNVREMYNTLQRAALWSEGQFIEESDAKESLLPRESIQNSILDRPIGDGFDIREIVSEVVSHYLHRAMLESGQVKKRAAELLGLPNPTTLNNWLDKHGVAPAK